jgi:hypothetical protein
MGQYSNYMFKTPSSTRTYRSQKRYEVPRGGVLFKCLLLAKDPTSTIGRSPGYSNKLCFPWFSHVTTSVPIRLIRNGLVYFSIVAWALFNEFHLLIKNKKESWHCFQKN